jgi:hypothetical protein
VTVTTRKAPRNRRPAPATRLAVILAGLLLGGTGCATPGPLHVYTIAASGAETIRDRDPTGGGFVDRPSFLGVDDVLTGFAYDPFTDHFFLRLAPGNRIRVVDRPAQAVKREFTISGLPEGGGDLAARPRDGHLFLVHPSAPALLECTRLGKLLRTIPLEGITEPPLGVAFDPARNEFLVLGPDGLRVSTHDPSGRQRREIRLERAAASLSFDPDRRELHAPLREGGGVATFDESGRQIHVSSEPAAFVDVGARSFIRVF